MSLAKGKKEKKEKLAHFIAALIILVHAYEKYELNEHSFIFFLISGIIFLMIALLHHRLLKIFGYADGIFFLIEALLCAFVAKDFFELDKKALPWFYVVAGLAYLIAAFIKGKRGKAKHNHITGVKNKIEE